MLDLGLPGKDGTEFLKIIRKDNTTPVIVLSARSEESDKVNALDLGANDYVTKPFGSAEFLARVRSTLRNHRRGSDAGKLPGGKFISGDLTIDYDVRRLYIGTKEIKLTQTEFNIMALLMGLQEDPQNFLLMHSIGVNVSGQIASVIAGGLILNFFG